MFIELTIHVNIKITNIFTVSLVQPDLVIRKQDFNSLQWSKELNPCVKFGRFDDEFSH